MTKVYPNPITPVAVSSERHQHIPTSPVVFTVWKKSLIFNCDGFTVLDANGNLVFRVDNYVAGGNGEIVLMDAFGHSLLTIRHKRLTLSDTWQVYDRETHVNPWISVTKHMNVLKTKFQAYVSKAGWSKNNRGRKQIYEMEGSYGERCCVVYDDMRRCVADFRSKEAKAGVALGGDVFRLVVQPIMDPTVAMALVIVLDQMMGSSRRFFM